MKTSAVVLNHLLSRDAVALGRLVLNVHSPEQDYLDLHFSLDPADVIVREQLNFAEILQKTSNMRLRGFFTSHLRGDTAKDDTWQSSISTVRNTTYQVKNSSAIFSRACETESTRKWLESAIS